MIDIKEYMISDVDPLCKHIAIDYYTSTACSVLLEKYGVFNGCEPLAAYIIEQNKRHIKNKTPDYDILLKNVPRYNGDLFFKTLHVSIKDMEDANAEYKEELSKWDDTNKLFSDIYIYVTPHSHKNLACMFHELTHAYDDYVLHLKGKEILDTDNQLYYKKIVNYACTFGAHGLGYILYKCFGYEANAFASQLKAELLQCKHKINSPLQAYTFLKNTETYKNYLSLEAYIFKWENNDLSNSEIDRATDAYNDIYNTHLSSNAILKEIKKRYKKVMKKLDTLIPKLCVENLDNPKIRLTKILEY